MKRGWIKDHRMIMDWEWYTNPIVCHLYRHLLLTVNIEDTHWQGRIIKRGCRVTTHATLCEETGLSRGQVERALKDLKDSKYIKITPSKKNSSHIFVPYFINSQGDIENSKEPSRNLQETYKEPSRNLQDSFKERTRQIKEYKEYKEDKKVRIKEDSLGGEKKNEIFELDFHIGKDEQFYMTDDINFDFIEKYREGIENWSRKRKLKKGLPILKKTALRYFKDWEKWDLEFPGEPELDMPSFMEYVLSDVNNGWLGLERRFYTEELENRRRIELKKADNLIYQKNLQRRFDQQGGQTQQFTMSDGLRMRKEIKQKIKQEEERRRNANN